MIRAIGNWSVIIVRITMPVRMIRSTCVRLLLVLYLFPTALHQSQQQPIYIYIYIYMMRSTILYRSTGPQELCCLCPLICLQVILPYGIHDDVSLTSQVCKVLEAIIRDNMMNLIKKYNLIKESQHELLKCRSCLTNVLECLEFVTNYID